MMKRSNHGGQVIVVAMVMLLAMAISVPLLIRYVRSESEWTMKQQRATRAFHLAETAVEQGYNLLLASTTTWANVIANVSVPGYNLDTTYADGGGGSYQIQLERASSSEVSITGVGKDASGKAVRSISVVYGRSGLSSYALQAQGLINIGGSVNVEWGAMTSFTSVATGGRNHPRFYSTGSILPQDLNLFLPPNTDNVQWWSFQTDLPPAIDLDFNLYRALAQSSPAPPAGCPASYYTTGNVTFKGCTDTSWRTYYITGNVTFQSGSGGNCIYGNVISFGSVTVSGNGGANCSYTTTIPGTAWREYGNDWNYYRTNFDPSAPASYAAAVSSNYISSTTYAMNNVLLHGLVYSTLGGTLTGGGNGRYHGVVLTGSSALLTTSNFEIFFDDTILAGLNTTSVSNLTRVSWAETNCSWTGANATCP